MTTPFESCVAAVRQPGPVEVLFKTVDKALADTVGHKLFTLLYVAPGAKRVKRIYTNMPKEYPVGGYKEVTESPWHKLVIGERTIVTPAARDAGEAAKVFLYAGWLP